MIATLPKPPSVNNLYKRSKWGGLYIGEKGQEWFKEAGRIIKQGKSYEGDVSLYAKLFYCGRYDIDNGLKALQDLFMHQYWIKDDGQIMFAQIEKVKVKHRKDEKIEVEIPEI